MKSNKIIYLFGFVLLVLNVYLLIEHKKPTLADAQTCVPFSWPKGNYCILQGVPPNVCPAGFTPGAKCLDTEDDGNDDFDVEPIGNSHNGCKGGHSSEYFGFCCRND